MPPVCSTSTHSALKADRTAWLALEYVGIQRDGDGQPELELRNCKCGSTLCLYVGDEQEAA